MAKITKFRLKLAGKSLGTQMASRKKKQNLWNWIGDWAEPFSLSQILTSLNNTYAERSVRRWLAEMVEEGLLSREGQGKNTRYRVLVRQRAQESPFSPNSLPIIEQVRSPIYERAPVAYSKKWLEGYQPNSTYYLSLALRTAFHEAGNRSSDGEPAGTYARHILNRLLIDLSFNSSRLEGNTYSLVETERLILAGEGAQGKLDEERIMILNHKEAIRYLIDNASKLAIDQATLQTLHFLLADGLVEHRQAGHIRDHGVRIGGSSYIPYEDPRQLEVLMKTICDKGAEIKDPFEQSLFLLIHLSYLQAFTDVNKRTARLAANIPLISNNFVPLSFNDVKRDDYTSAMIAIYELQKVEPLIDLIVFTYLRTCQVYDATLQAVGYDEIRVRYRQTRRAVIREIILQRLIGKPMTAFIAQAAKEIPAKDRPAFIQDVDEDLEVINQSRIAGLGITPDQLNNWLQKRDNL